PLPSRTASSTLSLHDALPICLPESWSTTQNVVWKVEVPGRGLSSPIVWGDQIFLTSCISEGKIPAAKKGLYFGGEQFKPPADVQDRKSTRLNSSHVKISYAVF